MGRPKKVVKKKIEFSVCGGEERTETVSIDDYEDFDITFRIQNAADKIDAAIIAESESSSSGEILINQILKQLKSWTLKKPLTKKTFLSMKDVSIIFVLASKIAEAEDERKN